MLDIFSQSLADENVDDWSLINGAKELHNCFSGCEAQRTLAIHITSFISTNTLKMSKLSHSGMNRM